MRRGVAADHDGSPLREIQARDDGQREPRRLVGDDAPGNAGGLERRQHLVDALERMRALQQPGLVVREERVAQRLELGLPRRHAEGDAHHAARAGAHHRAQHLERQRFQPVVGAQAVGGAGEVGGAVDQRAVEVEQHAAHGADAGGHQACGRRHATM